MHKRIFVAVLAVGCIAAGLGLIAGPPEVRQRVAPPADLKCNRDKLTVFSGVAQSLAVRAGEPQGTLTIATDWKTIETVRIPVGRDVQLSWFLFKGTPFTRDHFSKLFVQGSELRPNVRVNAWVCSDPSVHPILDWDTPKEGTHPGHAR